MKVFVSLLTLGVLVGFKNVSAAPIDEAAAIIHPCPLANPECHGPFGGPFVDPHDIHRGPEPLSTISDVAARDEDTTQRICPLGEDACGPIFEPDPVPCLPGVGICSKDIAKARDEESVHSFCPLGEGKCSPLGPILSHPRPRPCPLSDKDCHGPFHGPLTGLPTPTSGNPSAIVARDPERTASYHCRDGDPTCYKFHGPKRDVASTDRLEARELDERNSTLETRDTSLTYFYYPNQNACPGAPDGGWAGSVTVQNNECISINQNYARYVRYSTCQLNFFVEPNCQGGEGTIYQPINQQCLIPGSPFVSLKAVFC